eukprot:16063565-Heterocapsa_arctica.AAC.1
MRKQQLTLNRMRKHMILVNQGKGQHNYAFLLQAKLENKTGIEAIRALEELVDRMRNQIRAERTQR